MPKKPLRIPCDGEAGHPESSGEGCGCSIGGCASHQFFEGAGMRSEENGRRKSFVLFHLTVFPSFFLQGLFLYVFVGHDCGRGKTCEKYRYTVVRVFFQVKNPCVFVCLVRPG